MNVPTHLQHTPIIGVPFYSIKDGKIANDTDARALSIGNAQYKDGEYSAKVFRFSDDSRRWSPQSEELPFHRVLDLAILLVTTIAKANGEGCNSDNLKEEIINQSELSGLFEYLNKHENKDELRKRLVELGIHIEKTLKIY